MHYFALPGVSFPLRVRLLAVLAFFVIAHTATAQQKLSEDRELKDIDISAWRCLNRPEGTAKTPDGAERNRLKNRSIIDGAGTKPKSMDTAEFLKFIGDCDRLTKGMRRKELESGQRVQLDPLEKQLVSLTGYLVLAYPGPPESTNCGDIDFHDWHLEVFEKPLDHPPGIGDPTPIICEITPRTQREIFRDNIRLQALAAYIRAPDFSHEPTGHPAKKVRITGYLLWDDDHNGSADVGTTVRRIGANKYHNPWRSTAWEIHPVTKIEPLEAVAAPPAGPSVSPASSPDTTAPTESPAPGSPAAVSPPATATPSPTPQLATLTQPVKIKIPYGETVLPRGTKLPVASRDAQTVTIQYMGGNYAIPVSSTDLH